MRESCINCQLLFGLVTTWWLSWSQNCLNFMDLIQVDWQNQSYKENCSYYLIFATVLTRYLCLLGAIFYIFTNSYFQIQNSVTAKQVLLLSELLKIGETIARNKLKESIISKDSYSKTVMKLKQRFVHGLLKQQNKAIR